MRQINALVKPSSSACNLKCEYCFYCDEAKIRSRRFSGIMSLETAEAAVKKIFDFCGSECEVTFMFQGGEPTLAGKEFFRSFILIVNKSMPKGAKVHYAMQTNGILIDDEWCEIFKDNLFLVGLSLDGYREIHDKYRRFPDGSGTFDRVMQTAELLKKHSVDFNILSVITADSAADAKKLWDFYIENDFRFVQPICCLDSLAGGGGEFSLSAREYARFQKRMFNYWLKENREGRPFYVSYFNNLAALLSTGTAEQCGISGQCNAQLVIEADGTCYPCDFFCIDEFECPNINTSSLEGIIKSSGVRDFLSFNGGFNALCEKCEFLNACRGGCKRYRPLFNSEPGYCPQRDFMLHAANKLSEVR